MPAVTQLSKIELILLNALRGFPMTTNDLNIDLPKEYPGNNSHDAVHHHMRTLEDKGFVRRSGFKPNKWELTDEGRSVV